MHAIIKYSLALNVTLVTSTTLKKKIISNLSEQMSASQTTFESYHN